MTSARRCCTPGRLCRQQRYGTRRTSTIRSRSRCVRRAPAWQRRRYSCAASGYCSPKAALADAADAFERGLQSGAMRGGLTCEEAAHARGLCGDADTAASHYAICVSLKVIPNASVVGELLSTLAAHHEREAQDISTAAAFFRRRETRTAMRLQMAEATRTRTSARAYGRSAAHWERSPKRRRRRRREMLYCLSGCVQQPSATATPSSCSPASSKFMTILLHCCFGTSRLSNYGAPHAAALNTEESKRAAKYGGHADDGDRKAMVVKRMRTTIAYKRPRRVVRSSSKRYGVQRDRADSWRKIVTSLIPTTNCVASIATVTRVGCSGRACCTLSTSTSRGNWKRRGAHVPPHLTTSCDITNAQSLAGFAPSQPMDGEPSKGSGWGDEVVKVSVSPSGRFDGAEERSFMGLVSRRGGASTTARDPHETT